MCVCVCVCVCATIAVLFLSSWNTKVTPTPGNNKNTMLVAQGLHAKCKNGVLLCYSISDLVLPRADV